MIVVLCCHFYVYVILCILMFADASLLSCVNFQYKAKWLAVKMAKNDMFFVVTG